MDINRLAEEFESRAVDLLREQLVENEKPPSVETLARYLSEELTKQLIVELDDEESPDPDDDPLLDYDES